MRRLRLNRPETILRKLDLEIRGNEGELLKANRSRRFLDAGLLRSKLVALQTFREKAFGLYLRPYSANKPLFPKGASKA